MTESRYPLTPAIHFLREQEVSFVPRLFHYEENGGTAHSSKELGVDEHTVIKTLIMETDAKAPLVILMHGDRQVSTKDLARAIGVKSVAPCAPETANRHTGYQVGGTSPFGLKTAMPIYLQSSVLDLEQILINGGGRGFLVEVSPTELVRVLNPVLVDVAREARKDR